MNNNNKRVQKKQSKSNKQAQRGVQLRQATASLSIPQSSSMSYGRLGQGPRIGAPTSQSRSQRVLAPKITRSARGMRIVHRELIESVNGSTNFATDNFAINPGLALTFPWLAPQAVQWEQYRFHKLEFEYVTRTSTSTVGSIILAPDYDANDAAPSSEAQITTYQDAVEDAPWKDQLCVLQVDSMFPLGPRKYVRSAAVPDSDIKTYDVANFFVGKVGMSNSDPVGKLWVCYDVELFVPQTGASSSISAKRTSFYSFPFGSSVSLTTGIPSVIPFTSSTVDALNWGTGVFGVFTPPAGNYEIEVLADLETTGMASSLQTTLDGTVGMLTTQLAQRSDEYANNGTTEISGIQYISVSGSDQVYFDVVGVFNNAAALKAAFLRVSLA